MLRIRVSKYTDSPKYPTLFTYPFYPMRATYYSYPGCISYPDYLTIPKSNAFDILKYRKSSTWPGKDPSTPCNYTLIYHTLPNTPHPHTPPHTHLRPNPQIHVHPKLGDRCHNDCWPFACVDFLLVLAPFGIIPSLAAAFHQY